MKKIRSKEQVEALVKMKVKELKELAEFYQEQAEEYRATWRLHESAFCISEKRHALRTIDVIESIFYEEISETS